MHWLYILITYVTAYFAGITYYLISDLKVALDNSWNLVKKENYNKDIWIVWIVSTIHSIKNIFFTAIWIYLFMQLFHSKLHHNSYVFEKIVYYIDIHYLFTETYFYFTHCALHKWFYSFHKQHHKSEIIVASSALNADLIEHILLNTAPLYLSVAIFGIYDWLFLIMLFISTVNACKAHSGYTKHYLHSFHHYNTQYNYGFGLYIWDKLLGTYFDPTPLNSKKN